MQPIELRAQKMLYVGRGQFIQPGQTFYEDYKPRVDELLSSGKATIATYERQAMTPQNAIGLVSCIMPTKNRRKWVPRAIACFQAQTYQKTELIVLDNGDPIKDLVPEAANIRYVRLPGNHTTGNLRNMCCQMAQGEFIAHWDDDDWSHPLRIEEQLASLGGNQVSGYNQILFHGPEKAVSLYKGAPNYAVGTSLLYRRSWWDANRFPPHKVGEDWDFVKRAAGRIVIADGTARMVASTHGENTCPRSEKGDAWHKSTLKALPKEYPL
jgi:glycosyltransferase involved in cell wall biosynthesis